MILSVFGDESADETKQRVFAISGVFGLESEWLRAEAAWTALTNGEVFHAADWEYAGRGDEYKALVQAVASGPIAGVAFAIDLAAFNDVYPDTLRESAYMKCFARVVMETADNAARFNASNPNHQFSKIEYTFDNRPEIAYSAARAYGAFINDPDWTPAALLASKVSFECRTNPRIQIADLIAREGMKDLDRKVGLVAFPERRSKIALEASGRFKFLALGREYFQDERARWAEFEKDGFTQHTYHSWLIKKRAPDT